MPKYLFSFEATVEVTAPDEDTARDAFWLATDQDKWGVDEFGLPVPVLTDIIETDVYLVETTE